MDDFIKSFRDFKFYKLDKIENLEYPDDFYRALKYYLRLSEEATIYSMYVGTDGPIKDLLDCIKQRKNVGKKTKIILDKNRGFNKQLEEFIKDQSIEDCFQFKDISCKFLVSRLKEMSAVFHSKLYMFDSDIIITGANLDNSYFINRLDRYFLIKNNNLSEDLKYNKINDKTSKLNIKNDKTSKLNIKNDKTSKSNIENDLTNKLNIENDTDYIFTYDQSKEIDVVSKILNSKFDSVYVSSAYFNLPKRYIDLLNKQRNICIFVNSPEMNHFDNFGFVGNLVTQIYKYSSYYALKFLKTAVLYEFKLEGFTMHKKGIWAFKEGICMTIIGSSNFNRRSVERDEELNFCVIARKKETVEIFRNEIDFLKSNSVIKIEKDFKFKWYDIIYILIFHIFNKYF